MSRGGLVNQTEGEQKKIPLPVMLIGTFEISIALLGLVILILVGSFNANSVAFVILLAIYGAMGAGLWAIREWARAANVVLHILAIPYALFTSFFLDGPSGWNPVLQALISIAIILTLTRPGIVRKFQTGQRKINEPD